MKPSQSSQTLMKSVVMFRLYRNRYFEQATRLVALYLSPSPSLRIVAIYATAIVIGVAAYFVAPKDLDIPPIVFSIGSASLVYSVVKIIDRPEENN